MTDPRLAVVAEALDVHYWERAVFGCDAEPICEWRADVDSAEEMRTQHDKHVATAVIAALDDYAARTPFSGRIPQPDPTWANEAHPTPEPGAPGAAPTYAERMGRA